MYKNVFVRVTIDMKISGWQMHIPGLCKNLNYVKDCCQEKDIAFIFAIIQVQDGSITKHRRHNKNISESQVFKSSSIFRWNAYMYV